MKLDLMDMRILMKEIGILKYWHIAQWLLKNKPTIRLANMFVVIIYNKIKENKNAQQGI